MLHDRALASDLVTLKAIDIEVKLNASTVLTHLKTSFVDASKCHKEF